MSCPRKSGCSSALELPEPLDDRSERGVQAILRGPGVEPDPCETVDVRRRVDGVFLEPRLRLVEEVGIGRLRQQGRLEVGVEGGLDAVGLVGEVEDHGAPLLRMRPVEPREGLNRVDPAELLVDVHRVEERLVEPGLKLVRDHEEPVLRPFEGPRRLRFRRSVHAGFGIPPAPVLNRAGERDQRLERMTLRREVRVHGELVAHCVEARAGDDHRLRPAANLALHPIREVVDHDPHLCVDRVRVKPDEGCQEVGSLPLVVSRVVLDRLPEPPVRLQGRVAREDVEDEPLLDGLPHAVEMERREGAVPALRSEELQGLRLRRRGEREGREIRESSPDLHLREDRVLELLLGRRGFGLLLLRTFEGSGREHRLEALRALTRLRGMRLVDDEGEPLARQLADLRRDDRELLEGGDDDRLAPLERVLELARGGVDVLHHPQGLLELTDGALELAVEDPAVGDDHDGIEDAAVVRIVQGGEPVGEPGDREALAAPRRVLDEVALARSPPPRIENEPAHAIELLVAGEDEEAPSGLAPVLVLFLDLVDELAHEVEHAVARPRLLPEIGGGVAGPGRGHGGIAGAAEPAPVEGEETRLAAGEVGRGVDELRVDGEMGETPAVGEERLARVAIRLVLPNRVLDGLPGQRVLELGREDGYAVQEEHEVEAPLVLGRCTEPGGRRRRSSPRGAASPPR